MADAVQEVLVRYLRHRARIETSVGGWLAATARSVCADVSRHRAREWRRRAQWVLRTAARQGAGPDLGAGVTGEAVRAAMGSLDDGDRALIERRYFERWTVAAVADWLGVSGATASRRIAGAVERLGALLDASELGVEWPVGDAPLRGRVRAPRGEGDGSAPSSEHIRPIRVGVLVSELSMRTPTDEGWHIGVEGQVRSVPLLDREGLELAALVEPGTGSVGGIERVVREYGLAGGVIDVTDARALYRELDVIYLGTVIAMVPRALDAVVRAVEMGVGLLNEHFAGSNLPGLGDPRVMRLMLAERAAEHHTPGAHGLPRPARVVRGHEVIPGMAPGTTLEVGGCGPVCLMAKGSTVLIERSDRPEPTHHIERLPNGGIMPVLAVGSIDGGRAVVVNEFMPERIGGHASYRGDFYVNVCRWLARAGGGSAEWMVRTPAR